MEDKTFVLKFKREECFKKEGSHTMNAPVWLSK